MDAEEQDSFDMPEYPDAVSQAVAGQKAHNMDDVGIAELAKLCSTLRGTRDPLLLAWLHVCVTAPCHLSNGLENLQHQYSGMPLTRY